MPMNSPFETAVEESRQQRDIWLKAFIEKNQAFCEISTADISVLFGWANLLDRVFAEIAGIVQEARSVNPEASLSVLQIKQKFGELRIYVNCEMDNPHADSIYALIDQAELEGTTTCEICGKPGTRRSLGGWIVTACQAHSLGTESPRVIHVCKVRLRK